MTIGAGIFLIAVGAILRFGVTTASTHGFDVHAIGDILMIIGVLGVALWLLVWAPWGTRARSRRTVYRGEVPPGEVPPGEVPPGEVPPPAARRYPGERTYETETYEDEYRR